MKLTSQQKGLDKLQKLKNTFAEVIQSRYEHRAKPCATCETPGACCLDAHFVNVRITRLEAVAIRNRLNELSPQHREAVFSRIGNAIKTYKLDEENSEHFACPLFEKGTGCFVHHHGKPLPCIAHACYERDEDLPPDELLTEREIEIDRLNRAVYGSTTLLPLPVAIKRFSSAARPGSSSV
jgi:hypothetical protein